MGPTPSHDHLWVKEPMRAGPHGMRILTMICEQCGARITRMRGYNINSSRVVRYGGMSSGFDDWEEARRYLK